MGWFYGSILYVFSTLPLFLDIIGRNNVSNGFLYKSIDMVMFIGDNLLEIVILLAGMLAASMAILWAAELWIKKGIIDRNKYKNLTSVAIKVVTAFFVVVISIVLWVAIPTIDTFIKMLESIN